MTKIEWYVVVESRGYPQSIYISRECANLVAQETGCEVVPVVPRALRITDNKTHLQVQVAESSRSPSMYRLNEPALGEVGWNTIATWCHALSATFVVEVTVAEVPQVFAWAEMVLALPVL